MCIKNNNFFFLGILVCDATPSFVMRYPRSWCDTPMATNDISIEDISIEDISMKDISIEDIYFDWRHFE
jgi:hypothetical protein